MITTQELQALAVILQRTPVTLAEQMWLQELINRMAAEAKAREKPADDNVV